MAVTNVKTLAKDLTLEPTLYFEEAKYHYQIDFLLSTYLLPTRKASPLIN